MEELVGGRLAQHEFDRPDCQTITRLQQCFANGSVIQPRPRIPRPEDQTLLIDENHTVPRPDTGNGKRDGAIVRGSQNVFALAENNGGQRRLAAARLEDEQSAERSGML
jgi:hypothetical protein